MTHLPRIELPRILVRTEEPESLDDAEAERRELVAVLQNIDAQLRQHGRNVGDFHHWRSSVLKKRNHVLGRLQWIKGWIKQANRDASDMMVMLCAGEDLDDPVTLVAKLRGVILEMKREGRITDKSWDKYQPIVDSSTAYLQLIARERSAMEREDKKV